MGKRGANAIVARWKEQMKKGYLKLAVLFALTRRPTHGYEMIKRIRELTLGFLTPKAGALYPTLKKLEENGLIKGKWKIQGKRKVKVYEITPKGKEVFKKAVERHFAVISASRILLLKELKNLGFIEKIEDVPEAFVRIMRVLLLDENVPPNETIEALEKLKQGLQKLTESLNIAIENIDEKIRELEAETSNS